jgi:hypothetical protein
MTREHLIRTGLILVAFLAALGAAVYLLAHGQSEGTFFGTVIGWLSLLVPALLDSTRVAQVQRKATKAAASVPPPAGEL